MILVVILEQFIIFINDDYDDDNDDDDVTLRQALARNMARCGQLLRLPLVPGSLNMAEAALEADTGHLVSDQTQETCQCGLRTRGQATLIPALEIYNSSQCLSPSTLTKKSFTGNLNVLESFTYKKAAILTAVEAAQNLSNIGMILNC